VNPESCQGAMAAFSLMIPEDSWKRLKDVYSGFLNFCTKCMPEMKKDKLYKLLLHLDPDILL